jgi:hypothetical protein
MADRDAPGTADWYPSSDNDQLLGYWDGQAWSSFREWNGTEWVEVDAPPQFSPTFDQSSQDLGTPSSEATPEKADPKMGIASLEQKQQVVKALKNTNSKYAKPFEKGRMANVSFMGGNWENYAQIVMEMVSADTLLQIQGQLETLNRNIETLIAKLSES